MTGGTCNRDKMKTCQKRDRLDSNTGELDDNCGRNSHSTDLTSPQRKRTKTPQADISPLLINHVVKQIFSDMSISELASFRLVCREWNLVATKCLQSKLDFITIGCRNANHSLYLHNNHSDFDDAPFVPLRPHAIAFTGISTDAASSGAPLINPLVTPSMNAEQLNKFLEIVSYSTNSPFIKFEIVSSFFVPENQRILQRFFQLISPLIEVLKISLDNRAPGDFSPQFLAGITFPKLKSVMFEVLRQFTLTEIEEPDDGEVLDESSITSELRDNAVSYHILSAISFSAPNLESLAISLQRRCDAEGQRQFNLDGTQNFEHDRRAGLGNGGTCPCQHFHLPINDFIAKSSGSTMDANVNLEHSNISAEKKYRNSPDERKDTANASSESFNDSKPISISGSLMPTEEPTTASASAMSMSSVVNCHLPLPINIGYQSTPLRISNSPKLKSFHLRLRNSFIHQTCITSLLERLERTLEHFALTEEGHGSRVLVNFPKMTRLSTLTISSICEFEQNFVSILPFSYTEKLPSLSVLNLWDCFGTEQRYEQLFLSNTPGCSVNKLVLPSQFRNVSLAQNIPRVFPKLKSLTLVFSTRPDNLAVIQAVFQICGESLEELHLITDMDVQNQNVDYILTGLPKEICQKMKKEENFLLPLYIQHGTTRKASLVNLKRVKRLIFQLEHKYSRAPLITDVTGYLAFMEMPNLQYLRFTRYGMTWDCCEALSRKCRTDILLPYGNNVFEFETLDFDFD